MQQSSALPASLFTASPQEIARGFRIEALTLRDEETGKLMWSSAGHDQLFQRHTPTDSSSSSNAATSAPERKTNEGSVRLPAQILKLRAVSRQVVFSTVHPIRVLRVQQDVRLHDHIIEQWNFDIGLCPPGSTNTWTSCIDAVDEDQATPADVLSGNVTIDTRFLDGDVLLAQSMLRVFYV